jgi:hypothetical protein
MFYAFRDRLGEAGLELLGQLAGYVTRRAGVTPRSLTATKRSIRACSGTPARPRSWSWTPNPISAHREDNGDWREEVQPNLDQLKATKRAAVNTLKNEKENGKAPTPFGVVDADDSSKIKITGLVNMALISKSAGQPFSQSWTKADNTEVILDADGAVVLGVAVGQFVSAVHAHALQLKAQIEAIEVVDGDTASAVAALEAIDINAGWPAVTSSAS